MTPLYSILYVDQKEISLMTVIPIDLQLALSLEAVSLLEKPIFSAVSYAWVDTSRTEDVIVNSTFILVPVSLVCALASVCYCQENETSGKHH